jgi:hypothetical protein
MTLSNPLSGFERPGSNLRSSILDRLSDAGLPSEAPASHLQNQVDGLVCNFVEEASNPYTLAALMAGGLTYRVTRVGVMGMGSSFILRPLSVALGLGAEVSAFEFTNRALTTFRATGRSTQRENANLWSWSGCGGWQEGLIHSAISFGMLKSAGFLARDQNIIFQHLFQSSAMVVGHQTASQLGLSQRPEGNFASQLLQAEATNLQLGAGMSWVHRVAPGILALERSLEISLRNSTSLDSPLKNSMDRFSPLLATEATPFRLSKAPETVETQLLMTGSEDGDHKAANDNSYTLPARPSNSCERASTPPHDYCLTSPLR